ncbi:hypothetical protein [Endozoicomonas sp. 8E]|uniref:hypothetical protein n=1 Tax=Endozoicomonas sp. 8E TaxID=3035692 RepID=UPI00293940D1|nr:hypothetical protein [Endozoicomonas sp. 8E]WOG27978.1 hypothetical protein P6910_26125 [Endozoicomonas sp. 8E]
MNIATAGASCIEISEADDGVFVSAFKDAEGTSKTTSASEQVYLNHLDILRLNKIRLVFDSQFNTVRFSFHGKAFIISEFSDSEISEPYHSFLVPAILLMPEVLQLVVNLIQHLNEHPDGIEGEEAFPGGMLEQAEVNEYFISPDMTLFPTYPNTSFCRGSSHCVPLSQYAWLVYSGHGKAAIISDPYSSDEPMDGKKGKSGNGGGGKKTVYRPAPAGFTNFRVGSIRNGYIGLGSGGEDNDPPERATDYSRTPPEDRNDFEDNETSFLLPEDDEADEQDAQRRSDLERSLFAILKRNAVPGRGIDTVQIEKFANFRGRFYRVNRGKGNWHQLKDDQSFESSDSKEASQKPSTPPPETPATSDQEPAETETTVVAPDTAPLLAKDEEEPVVSPGPSKRRELRKGMSSRERRSHISIDDI